MGVAEVANTVAVDWVEGPLRWALTPSKEAQDENMYLKGNFAPVTEESVEKELPVKGKIPTSLSGAFLRNGPNPQFTPTGGYHWFDGDGMLHSMRLKDGKALAYANHWVRTNRFEQEKKAGKPVFTKIGDLQGPTALPMAILGGIKRKWQGPAGTANTALEFHAGRLLALNEGDLPFAVRVLCEGAIESIGSVTMSGKLSHPCTAHPKVCPNTGDLVFFGYHADKNVIDFSVANSKGEVVRTEQIEYRHPQMVHDFAITDTYAVFMDLCLLFDPQRMVKEGKLPFTYDKSKGARFGLIKRGAEDKEPIRWFDAKGCSVFHTVNAWEEKGGKRVKLVLCRSEEFELDLGTMVPDPKTGRYDKSDWKGGSSTLYEYTFDLETGATEERVLTPLPEGVTGMDFPKHHPALTGKQIKYCYTAVLSGPIATGVAKVDVATGAIVGKIEFPPGCFAGDTVFVPAKGSQSAWSASQRGAKTVEGAEDEGYLLTFVNDETKGNTAELWIMDARKMSKDPIARVSVPKRIPYGFHCTWIPESDIKGQSTEPLPEVAVAAAPVSTA